MINEEALARKMAAERMGLVKDPTGARLPDELWQQMLPAARSFLDDLAFELHEAEQGALAVSSHHHNTTQGE